MTQVFLGTHILENRTEFPDLPDEFFALIDPDGTNTIGESQKIGSDYRCKCWCKFTNRTAPFEAYIVFPESVWNKIVFDVEISQLFKGAN